ncbi:MAG: hypothetical protein HYX57_11640 [Chloroflexi bacterium]|nr:hypothetical protein [Chloroflexota bacterium]
MARTDVHWGRDFDPDPRQGGLPFRRLVRADRAEVRDRGATAHPDGPLGAGRGYWPEVGRLLLASYRRLHAALASNAAARSSAGIGDG